MVKSYNIKWMIIINLYFDIINFGLLSIKIVISKIQFLL